MRIWLIVLALISSPNQASADQADPRIRAFETGLRPAVEVEGEPKTRWTIEERMAHWNVPGVSVAVIRDGEVAWAKGYGVLQAGADEKVDAETVFSVGSLSKVMTASISLRLTQSGKLDLDKDVNDYLTQWKVPHTSYTEVTPVTLRGIMSHSAGLTVDGFPDYQPGEALPTALDTLEGRKPAKTGPVRAGYPPGSRMQYSGGGTTVEQMVIEDATGMKFTEAARRYVFAPLQMQRSTFENPIPETYGKIAKAHGPDGKPRALPRGYEAMPELAASGLWTTPSDYARLIAAVMQAYAGAQGGFLTPAVAREMLTEVGVSSFGLGPQLYGRGAERVFFHGGANDSYRAWMEGRPATGDGLVIFTNATNGDALYQEMRVAIADSEGWRSGRGATVPKISIPEGALEEFAGDYSVKFSDSIASLRLREYSKDHPMCRVRVRNGELYVDFGGAGEVRYLPEGYSHFVSENGDFHAEFVRDYAGDVSRLIFYENGYSIETHKARQP